MTPGEQQYQEIGNSLEEAVSSQMFGKPCFKVKGKAFMSFFEDCVVFKLPADVREKALSLGGAVLFDPSGKGRPMKEWVQLPYDHTATWKDFAKAALDFVKANA